MQKERLSRLSDLTKKSPLVVYIIAFLVGIFIGRFDIYNHFWSFISAFILITFSVLMYYIEFKFDYYRRATVRVLFLVTFTTLGVLSIKLSDNNANGAFVVADKDNTIFLVKIPIFNKPIKGVKNNFVKATLQDSQLKLYAYLDNKIIIDSIGIGDTLILSASFSKKANVLFSYCSSDNFQLVKVKKKSLFLKYLIYKDKYINSVKNLFQSQECFGTYMALIFGEKKLISKSLIDAYSNTGLMHLLAVSGLHVGYIYTTLIFILFFLGNSRFSILTKSLIIICLIWLYSVISGFSASILRATIMATIYQLSTILSRDKISLNTLCVSAVVILVFDPQSAFDLGFQLSFIAILSIIFIYPKFESIFMPSSFIIKYIWSTISITIACQIGTFVLVTLYFNKFPLYFILSNVLTIPLAAVIVSLALFLFILSPLDYACRYIALLIENLINLLNNIVKSIDELPYSSIEFTLNDGQAITLVLIICIFTLDLIKKGYLKTYVLLGLIINLIVCSL